MLFFRNFSSPIWKTGNTCVVVYVSGFVSGSRLFAEFL
ncbi:hypothetical protein MmTuc01_0535 [Methanosarcina mazei Tuc01]|uniref:Uncharacterized protein n=1 Tax=Methanosarcina mazei Tuc01 TaxID=1236903 RepID=M1Q134_METMZ|nr:hypothetical protein MmTuc01_0535 [Methanosarcina mazei Tuc01]